MAQPTPPAPALGTVSPLFIAGSAPAPAGAGASAAAAPPQPAAPRASARARTPKPPPFAPAVDGQRPPRARRGASPRGRGRGGRSPSDGRCVTPPPPPASKKRAVGLTLPPSRGRGFVPGRGRGRPATPSPRPSTASTSTSTLFVPGLGAGAATPPPAAHTPPPPPPGAPVRVCLPASPSDALVLPPPAVAALLYDVGRFKTTHLKPGSRPGQPVLEAPLLLADWTGRTWPALFSARFEGGRESQARRCGTGAGRAYVASITAGWAAFRAGGLEGGGGGDVVEMVRVEGGGLVVRVRALL